MEFLDLIMFLLVGGYAVVFFVYPHLSFAFLSTFFPLYLWRGSIAGVPTNFIEILIFVSFILWLFRWLIFEERKLFDRKFFREWWRLLLLLFVAATISVFIADQGVMSLQNGEVNSFKVAAGIWKSWVIVPIIYFVMFGSLINKKWYKKITFNAYLFSALFLGIWAIFQMLTGEYITIDGRASGPFSSANYLSLYIGPAILASGILAWQGLKKKDLTLWYMWVFIFCFVALIGSRSYGAFLALFVAGLFYFVMMTKSLKKVGLIALLFVFVGSIFLYTQKDTEKFQVLFEYDQRSSSSVRLQTWQIAGNLIKENPITGIGLGQFDAQYQLQGRRILGVQPHEETQLHPHNVFLSFWLNAGLLGFAFLLLIIGKIGRKIIKSRKHEVVFFASLFLLILVHGLVDQPFWKNDLSLLWWFIIALI